MMKPIVVIQIALAAAITLHPGCSRREGSPARGLPITQPDAASPAADDGPCAIVLLPQEGHSKLDGDISRLQARAAGASDPVPHLERLGWLFIAKGRQAADPGFFKIAEACARCMDSRRPGSPEALLLRGHVSHSLHRFADAEAAARELVRVRESPFDHGLLGDALMEVGRLDEAAASYQKMMDLKPCLQSYARAAHVRWLRGDLEGATGLLRMATRTANTRDPEAAAWAHARLALHELQLGDARAARRAAETALAFQEDHAAALLVMGRVLLAEKELPRAIEVLERAAGRSPLPEVEWALADALRAAGEEKAALSVEARLEKDGARDDPRTFALYLSTRGKEPGTALRLAEEELEVRRDVFTHDAAGWSLFCAGRAQESLLPMERALAEGTRDARLFLHRGLIARSLGDGEGASKWLGAASELERMLLPSERDLLSRPAGRLRSVSLSTPTSE
jgi:tetratricopeptide (TPR) repeat protein